MIDFKVNEGDYFKINLEMQRGINDDFYYARSDNGSSSDSLNQVQVRVEGSKLICEPRQLAAPFIGTIIAFEFDPLNNNDIETAQ